MFIHKASQVFDARIAQTTRVGRNIRLLAYHYDNHNNVTSRYDSELGISDSFTYDALDRLIQNRISLDKANQHGIDNPDFNSSFSYDYDKLGNITAKSGIGDYTYSNNHAGPHAVTNANGLDYQYDNVGNMLSAKKQSNSGEIERELEWSDFNKPTKISRNGKTVEFKYDANHNRFYKKNSDGIETFYFGKSYELNKNSMTGEVEHKNFIYADGKLIALNTQTRSRFDTLKDKQIRYLHYDALGSVDMISDGYGAIVERRSFDPWGKKRSVRWQETGADNLGLALITNRGFTGHEHIEEIGLIHMNGRVYDQALGRFLSADPEIQAPFVSNSFNRYAYVMNNPLKYTDPTGYSWTSFSNTISSYVSTAITSISNFFSSNSGTSSGGTDKGSKNSAGTGAPILPETKRLILADINATVFNPYDIDDKPLIRTGDQLIDFVTGGTIGLVESVAEQVPNILNANSETIKVVLYSAGAGVIGKYADKKLGGVGDVLEYFTKYGPNGPPVRINGDWSVNDMKAALLGHPPKGLGKPDLHHADQMPGSAIHEILPESHRGNKSLHPNKFNQGVTPEMRDADRKLHWWYRAREQGADDVLSDWIYD